MSFAQKMREIATGARLKQRTAIPEHIATLEQLVKGAAEEGKLEVEVFSFQFNPKVSHWEGLQQAAKDRGLIAEIKSCHPDWDILSKSLYLRW